MASRETPFKFIPPEDADDCSGGDCCDSKEIKVDSCCSSKIKEPKHGHDHGHKLVHINSDNNDSSSSSTFIPPEDSDDCSGGDNHGHDHERGHDHNHSVENQISSKKSPFNIGDDDDKTGYSVVIKEEEIELEDLVNLVCNSCDQLSLIPHAIQITRFRIANLCCAGEERIILAALTDMNGIESVSVNIIGRYALVKHCPVACCAPSSSIIDTLNLQRLGASIQEAASEGDDEEAEKFDWFRFFHVFIVFSLLIVGIIIEHGIEDNDVSMIVYLCSTCIGVVPVLHAAYTSIIRKTVDIHILMIVAICGAIGAKEYFDSSLVVSLFISAEMIESVVMQWVRSSVKMTSGIPKKALLSNNTSILIDDLKVGDVIVVRAGEMITVDGVVVKGEGVTDESAITGESIPLQKKIGDRAFSGSVVQNGYIEIEMDTPIGDSTLRKINEAVADVQADKGDFARIVDNFSLYWTPSILIISSLIVVIGGLVTKDWHFYGMKAIIVLVLACPCSIVIAAPIPSVCTIAVAARNGVLIRGCIYLF
jgi:Cd2+/Zn2+-exporting ATPase